MIAKEVLTVLEQPLSSTVALCSSPRKRVLGYVDARTLAPGLFMRCGRPIPR